LPLAAVSFLGMAPQVARAFREGGGVNFEEYSEDCCLGLDLMNRGNYDHRLAGYWLRAMPEAAMIDPTSA